MSAILANSSASASGGMGMFGMIIWLVVIFGFMYFLMIRPQKKEQKKKELENRIAFALQAGKYEDAKKISEELEKLLRKYNG